MECQDITITLRTFLIEHTEPNHLQWNEKKKKKRKDQLSRNILPLQSGQKNETSKPQKKEIAKQ